jgi:hypothetical protein
MRPAGRNVPSRTGEAAREEIADDGEQHDGGDDARDDEDAAQLARVVPAARALGGKKGDVMELCGHSDSGTRARPGANARVRAYRAAGADPPFADPGRAHGAALEGYYWRIVDVAAGSVTVVLCGVCQGPGGPWAIVALAAHPGGFSRHAVVEPASADRDAFGARAGDVLRGSARRLLARVGDDSWVDLRLRSVFTWPRRMFGALGPAHLVPGLGQYWHPVVLAGVAEGEVCLGGVRTVVDGATAYAEKNWGPGFAEDWW